MNKILLGLCVSLCASAAVGCGGSAGSAGSATGPQKVRTDVPDPPAGGVQIVSPSYTVPAGEERFTCMRLDYKADHDLYVQNSHVYQTQGGHHVVIFYNPDNNTKGIDPTPHQCNGFEMTNVRFATTGTGNGGGLEMPAGIVLTLPAGVEIWSQSHYINTTDHDLVAQDVVNLETVPKSEVKQFASTFAHVDLTFSLPARQQTTAKMQCTLPQDMSIPWLLPHMHEWGSYFKMDVSHQGSSIYHWEGQWDASLRDEFPILNQDPPLQVSKGDVLTTECTWQNDLDSAITFPKEMCVTFFPFFPGDGSLLACDETGSVQAQ